MAAPTMTCRNAQPLNRTFPSANTYNLSLILNLSFAQFFSYCFSLPYVLNLTLNYNILFKNIYHCRWIHLECDKPTDQELDSQLKEEYICTYCKHLAAAEMDALQPVAGVEMADITAGTLGPSQPPICCVSNSE